MERDISTEEKIKTAARKVFHEKGYGLTRTRDIAEEAGINLALLNYYFRSKEKLFDIIMIESIHEIFSVIAGIVNNEETSLPEKIDQISNRYMDTLLKNPNLPIFVLSELQANPNKLFERVAIPDKLIARSYFYKQMEEQLKLKNIDVDPIQMFVNIVSLTVFPLVGKPLLHYLHVMDEIGYRKFVEERRKLVPMWVKSMLKLDE